MRPTAPTPHPLGPPPVLPVPQQTFTIEAALQAWTENDAMSFVSFRDDIDQARQILQNGICSDEGARAALNMADYLLLYGRRNMARYFYYQVVQYCLVAAPSLFNMCSQIEAMVQTAKMISVDRGIATPEDCAAALAILEWTSLEDEEARLWLEHWLQYHSS